jgi:hypothetical protein
MAIGETKEVAGVTLTCRVETRDIVVFASTERFFGWELAEVHRAGKKNPTLQLQRQQRQKPIKRGEKQGRNQERDTVLFDGSTVFSEPAVIATLLRSPYYGQEIRSLSTTDMTVREVVERLDRLASLGNVIAEGQPLAGWYLVKEIIQRDSIGLHYDTTYSLKRFTPDGEIESIPYAGTGNLNAMHVAKSLLNAGRYDDLSTIPYSDAERPTFAKLILDKGIALHRGSTLNTAEETNEALQALKALSGDPFWDRRFQHLALPADEQFYRGDRHTITLNKATGEWELKPSTGTTGVRTFLHLQRAKDAAGEPMFTQSELGIANLK